MKHLSPVLLALVVACAASSTRQRPPFPPPDPSKLSPTEALGYQIYQLDRAAWLATDAAHSSGLRDTPIQGWLVLPSGSTFLVRFIGACASETCSFIDVQLGQQTQSPTVSTVSPPESLPEGQAAMWRARQLALASPFNPCTPKYNTVVVPAVQDGAEVWRVYLLAASEVPEEVVLTGHHRITVSADGRTLLSSEALSKSCLVNRPETGQEVAGLVLTHVLHPEPIETHVFTSLNYRLPLYVGTEKGTFKVEGTSIRLIDPR